MSASSDAYRTVFGAVQFDPESREAAGKSTRQVTIRQTGFGPTAVKVKITFWEEDFPALDINRYDVILVDGKYSSNKGKDGTVYHNLSASRFLNLGPMTLKNAIPTTASDEAVEEFEESEIPF